MKYPWLWIAIALIVLNAAGWGLFLRNTTQKAAQTTELLPWSVFFSSARPMHLVTSDPDIAEIQTLTHSRISVSDYANHNYLPADNKLSPEIQQICLTRLDGRKAATLDAKIATAIAGVAKNSAKAIEVEGAREFQFANLKTDDNFIFLGSPLSDPWFSVFNDQLDFRIAGDPTSGGEVIQNVHPAGNEQTVYSPTSRGGSTGQSFAVVAFVANRDQDGHVLLLAGTNGEATQAAGKLITDLPRLSAALQQCGIAPASQPRHFEMLLRVQSMARYPEQFDVLACHMLPGGGH